MSATTDPDAADPDASDAGPADAGPAGAGSEGAGSEGDISPVRTPLEEADGGSVGILGGTGPQGRGLGLRFALSGRPVVLGSRDADRGAEVANGVANEHGLGDILVGGDNARAADADLVIVSVPFDGLADTVTPLRDALTGKVVVSCVNRLAFDDGGVRPVPVDEGSAAQLLARLLPDALVVAAFHHVPAGRLRRTGAALDMDVLIVGDDDAGCERVRVLAETVPGTRGVVAGPLRLARPLEELTAVIVSVNERQGVTVGVRLAGLEPAVHDIT